MDCEKLVKLTDYELQKLSQGELIFIEHPEKGICKVDMEKVYVSVIYPTLDR